MIVVGHLMRLALALALPLAGIGAQAALAAAPATPPGAVSAAALDHEPPAVRRLIERANVLEAGVDDEESEWLAASLYCEASRLGSIEGQYRLGMLYAFGKGVPANRRLAASLFSQASSQGHFEANKMLDTIQMESNELPTCVIQAVAPERAPPRPKPVVAVAAASAEAPQPIDDYLESLPESRRWIVPLVKTLGEWYAVDHRLVLSVIAVESNFKVSAESPKAAMGLMQLIPDTAARFNVRNAFDATQNIKGGIAYLRWLLSYYRGNISYALAAYNAGEGRVDRYKGIPPFPETRDYVARVMALYGRFVHVFDEGITAASPMLK
jgi:hypothetical protein